MIHLHSHRPIDRLQCKSWTWMATHQALNSWLCISYHQLDFGLLASNFETLIEACIIYHSYSTTFSTFPYILFTLIINTDTPTHATKSLINRSFNCMSGKGDAPSLSDHQCRKSNLNAKFSEVFFFLVKQWELNQLELNERILSDHVKRKEDWKYI